MTVPNAENAVVPVAKLTTYLLALSHPVGGSKARFFRAHGFDDQHADLLAHELRRVATGVTTSVRPSPFGTKYVVISGLTAPRGTVVQIETVWIIEPHDGPAAIRYGVSFRPQPHGDPMISELDTVVLAHDLSSLGLKKGDVGAVVHVYEGGSAVEVEFVSGSGSTVAVETLRSSDVRPLGSREILHARALVA